jgi:hypothetical protein
MSDEQAERRFRKVVVARYSPQNDCLVADGEVLYPGPSVVGARNGASHDFISTSDHRTRSKFGWVECQEAEFTLREFVQKYSLKDLPEQASVLSDLLTAISGFPEGTSVAASYFKRGVEHQHIVLKFHKVLLYKTME